MSSAFCFQPRHHVSHIQKSTTTHIHLLGGIETKYLQKQQKNRSTPLTPQLPLFFGTRLVLGSIGARCVSPSRSNPSPRSVEDDVWPMQIRWFKRHVFFVSWGKTSWDLIFVQLGSQSFDVVSFTLWSNFASHSPSRCLESGQGKIVSLDEKGQTSTVCGSNTFWWWVSNVHLLGDVTCKIPRIQRSQRGVENMNEYKTQVLGDSKTLPSWI